MFYQKNCDDIGKNVQQGYDKKGTRVHEHT